MKYNFNLAKLTSYQISSIVTQSSLLVLGALAAAYLAVAEVAHVGVGERGLQPEGALHQLGLRDHLAQADRRLRLRRRGGRTGCSARPGRAANTALRPGR